MTIRAYYNYFLVRLGIRKLLPKIFINRIKVRECGEPIVHVPENDCLVLSKENMCGRKGVIDRLLTVAHYLERYDLKLLVLDLYRSPQMQEIRREELRALVISEHPDYSHEQIEALLNRQVAGVGGGHQTGGAVDLTLCDSNKVPLDMGTDYMEHNEKTATHYKGLTKEQQRNRKVLLKAMKMAGFVNYPAEWWHYAYGDKLWAAYKNKPYAKYGVK